MVTAYAKIMLHSKGRAALVGGGMTGLYLYLLALLQEQEYSLLACLIDWSVCNPGDGDVRDTKCQLIHIYV